MDRALEILSVSEPRQLEWLAGQLDEEVSRHNLEVQALRDELRSVSAELAGIRGILTRLLIAIVIALVSVPVGVIWATAAGT